VISDGIVSFNLRGRAHMVYSAPPPCPTSFLFPPKTFLDLLTKIKTR